LYIGTTIDKRCAGTLAKAVTVVEAGKFMTSLSI